MLGYSIDGQVLCFVTVGGVDYEEGLRTLLLGLSEYRGTCPAPARVVFDISRSTENRTGDEIRGIAQVIVDQLGPCRIALVATTPLLFGLSRMLTIHLDLKGVTAAVFKERSRALEWVMSSESEPGGS